MRSRNQTTTRDASPTEEHLVEARRSGSWWALTVRGMPGVHSQVKRLEQASSMARDAIALALDAPPSSVQVSDPVPVLDAELDALVATTKAKRDELTHLRREVDALSRQAARGMAAHGVPVRDIATVLGVSFQHAARLARPGA